jgi:hypothetical protein
MVAPVDAVRAFHNAFRRDMANIDKAALDAARGKSGLEATIDRFRFFNEILVIHASGEELGIFPALEQVAPLVAEAYIQDHRGLDSAFDALNEAVSAHDPLETARASAAFKFHLDIHLAKEDTHLYRLFAERLSAPEQGKAVGIMASTVPPQRYPEMIAWLFPLLSPTDRENLTRIWQMTMPAENFAGAVQLIRGAVGDGWAELASRVPGLEA